LGKIFQILKIGPRTPPNLIILVIAPHSGFKLADPQIHRDRPVKALWRDRRCAYYAPV